MDQTQITKWTRRGIREFKPDRLSDDEITLMTLQGVNHLGVKIKALDSSFYLTRKVLQSSTHIFTRPSDCNSIVRLWDLTTTAGTITDASLATPINIECVDHGFEDDEIVTIQDVTGNTAANGTWVVTYVDDDNFTLNDSVGTAAWVSGGICFKEPQTPQIMVRINLEQSSLGNTGRWYPREDKIIVDQYAFENDILIDYIRDPSAITDIPAEYHMGLVAFNVVHLIVIPPKDQNNQVEFQDKVESLQRYKEILRTVEGQIAGTFRPAYEAVEVEDEDAYDWNREG